MSAQHRRTPRHAELSQHFLRSGALARELVAQSHISKHDLVVEIGPGRGALTEPLARECRELIGVELDPRLCEFLRHRFEDYPEVAIIHGDFLHFSLPRDPYKVLGNIPFGRTSAILRRLLYASHPPTDAHVILQREAAHRFAGAPHAPESMPSLLIKPEWQAEIVRHLRRTDFDPPPGVDTTVLWLARRTRPLIHSSELERYRLFVKSSFGQGGNTILRCLRSTFTHAEIRRLGTDLRFRLDSPPSALTFDQWLGLFRFHVIR